MLHKAWNSKGEMPYCFPRSSIKFQGYTIQNITDFDPNWAFPDYRPVAAFKSLRFALLSVYFHIAVNNFSVSFCEGRLVVNTYFTLVIDEKGSRLWMKYKSIGQWRKLRRQILERWRRKSSEREENMHFTCS